jgi:Amt family ammonium transporter
LLTQLTGVLVVGATVFPVSLGLWYAIRQTVGLRVAPEEELLGLDIAETGMEAYPQDSVAAAVG